MLADEGEQLLVVLGVANIFRVRLNGEDTYRPSLGLQRNAEPARVVDGDSEELDLALLGQLHDLLVAEQLRRPGAQNVGSRPPRVAAAELVPVVRIGEVGGQLIDVIGPADQLPLLVVERDEEVGRRHQVRDDGVHRSVELLHVLCRARELGDPVERGLHLLGADLLGLRGPRTFCELRRRVGFRSHRSSRPGRRSHNTSTAR